MPKLGTAMSLAIYFDFMTLFPLVIFSDFHHAFTGITDLLYCFVSYFLRGSRTPQFLVLIPWCYVRGVTWTIEGKSGSDCRFDSFLLKILIFFLIFLIYFWDVKRQVWYQPGALSVINKLLECVSAALSWLPLWRSACQYALTLPLLVAFLGVSSRQIRTYWNVLVLGLCLQCPSLMAVSVSGEWRVVHVTANGSDIPHMCATAGACHSFQR